ncbi:hypothetical protein BDQ17DRAFT_1299286 [Cyathus striatus]|nr:hypothetical protein BDQ17DRAFT_1299286 [Cyathus striatus]
MIVDLDDNTMRSSQDSPPAYEHAVVNDSTLSDSKVQPGMKPSMDPTQSSVPYAVAGSSYTSQHVPRLPNHTVYHYNNPRTGEHIASLLPPDNPEMICLQAGMHVPQTKYGLLGVLAAIFWFPLGIGLCLLDRRVRCTRCGLVIDEGLCH